MNHLSPLLAIGNVLLDPEVISRKRLFEEASILFENTYGIPHTDAFDALFAREKLGCTCVGRGSAIPHGSLDELEKPVLAFIRPQVALELDAPDGKPVQLFFFVLVPTGTKEQYSNILHELCLLLDDKDMRQSLLTFETPLSLCEMIANWKSPLSDKEDVTDSPEEENTP